MRHALKIPALLAMAIAPAAALAQPATPPGLRDELVGIETGIWKAWTSKDEDYYFARLTRDAVVIIIGQGMMRGRDRVVEEITASPCALRAFNLSREQVRLLTPTVAVLSYAAEQDGSCGTHKLPPRLQVSSVYVREDEGWKLALYQETPVDLP